MYFEHSPKTKEWIGRVSKFMDDHIFPAVPTYEALHRTLERYEKMLTRFEGDRVFTNAVTVVVSGERAREVMQQQKRRFATCTPLNKRTLYQVDKRLLTLANHGNIDCLVIKHPVIICLNLGAADQHNHIGQLFLDPLGDAQGSFAVPGIQ